MGSEKWMRILAMTVMMMISIVGGGQGHELRTGYYEEECKNAEDIVYQVVKERFDFDKTIVAALLRMQFHDCFVGGCDASLLLDGDDSEKTAVPNGSVRGYELIDEAKKRLEKECPETVSCADIVVIATRAAVQLQSGYKYPVETGRTDGVHSSALLATLNLPPPNVPVPAALALFKERGLDAQDFVLLLGGHTVGITHCSFVKDRIYDYPLSRNGADPSMDEGFVKTLRKICPRGPKSDVTEIFLDQSTPRSAYAVDNGFYKAIVKGKGLLDIDQRIADHPFTQDIVLRLSREGNFLPEFGKAMVKLGRVPRADPDGEIRRTCRATNSGVLLP